MSDTVHATIAEAAEKLAAAEKVLVTCHRGPDGDAVGSMVALASLLRANGVEATLYNPDLVPRRLKWMPLVKTLVHKLNKKSRYQVTAVVDCGDAKLLGDEFPGEEITGEVIAIDHHAAARPFGHLYVCDPEAASCGVLIHRMARHLGWDVTEDAAVGLWVSLVSDTGSFRYANTNAEALALAASLVDGGLDPWAITERMNERSRLSRYRLLAAALQTIELRCAGKVAFMTVTHEMIAAAKASWDESEGLVNYTRSIDGVECGVLFTPAKTGGVRVSMRSKGHAVDAGAVCLPLGGGGHVGAAGCTLEGEIPAAKERVEAALKEALREASRAAAGDSSAGTAPRSR